MQKKDDLRSQNDNSREYREKRLKQTEELLKKALRYIYESDKNFSHKNICTIMKVLATEEDNKLNATISPSAISKNQHYRQIIETYKIQNNIFKDKQKKLHLSEGDLAFELHKCKTILAQKSDEVKILRHIIEKEKIEATNDIIEIKKYDFDYKNLLYEAYKIMLNDGLALLYDNNLVFEVDKKKIIANKQLLEKIGLIKYEKNEI